MNYIKKTYNNWSYKLKLGRKKKVKNITNTSKMKNDGRKITINMPNENKNK